MEEKLKQEKGRQKEMKKNKRRKEGRLIMKKND